MTNLRLRDMVQTINYNFFLSCYTSQQASQKTRSVLKSHMSLKLYHPNDEELKNTLVTVLCKIDDMKYISYHEPNVNPDQQLKPLHLVLSDMIASVVFLFFRTGKRLTEKEPMSTSSLNGFYSENHLPKTFDHLYPTNRRLLFSYFQPLSRVQRMELTWLLYDATAIWSFPEPYEKLIYDVSHN